MKVKLIAEFIFIEIAKNTMKSRPNAIIAKSHASDIPTVAEGENTQTTETRSATPIKITTAAVTTATTKTSTAVVSIHRATAIDITINQGDKGSRHAHASLFFQTIAKSQENRVSSVFNYFSIINKKGEVKTMTEIFLKNFFLRKVCKRKTNKNHVQN
jgi:hypothetical protein